MPCPLIRRRTVWLPTLLGWAVLSILFITPLVLWWFQGEAFFSRTDRVPADVLVVEGWVGMECPQAVAAEFEHGEYRNLVITGGMTGEPWSQRRWSYVEETELSLIRHGVPKGRILDAPTRDTERQRTYEMAVASWRALKTNEIQPTGINVFTRSSHARRSRLVFAKVFGSSTKVGVISWAPPGYDSGPWWRSSGRAVEFLKETVGYLYELLLNSGRRSNAPAENR
jgi:uncharacterized SAM-binding protein YcdF (DUF218 family)